MERPLQSSLHQSLLGHLREGWPPKMLRGRGHLLKIPTAGDPSSQKGDVGTHLYVHHSLSFVSLGSTSSYTFREFSHCATKHLFLGKTRKRRFIGMNYSLCSYAWSWSCSRCSPSPFPIVQSRFLSPQAIPLLVLWLLWWQAPDPRV